MHTTLTDWEKSRNIIRSAQVHDRVLGLGLNPRLCRGTLKV